MLQKATRDIYDYYNRVRGQRPAPLRSEIDPAAMKTALPDVFILERGGDNLLRFRLAGTRLCSILGGELRNHEFETIWQPRYGHRMTLTAQTVITACRPAIALASATTDRGDALAAELLLLPLCSRPEICDRILGALVPIGATHALPVLSRHLRLEHSRLLSEFETTDIAEDGFGQINRVPEHVVPARPFGRQRPFTVIEGGRA